MSAPHRSLQQRLPFYYGWVIVASTFLAGMANSGPTLWGFSVFAVPMTEDLGWSRSALFGAITVRALFTAALAPIFGRLADKERWPKILMVVGGTVYSLSLVGLSTVHTQLEYFLIFSVVGGIATGAGGGLLRQALIAKWFVRRRGRATALGTMGTGMGAFIYPVATFALIDGFGWRMAWVILGGISFLMLVPIAFLMRRQPEDMGLLPDGDTLEAVNARRLARANASPGAPVQRDASDEYSFSLKEVVRTKAIWYLLLAMMLTGPSMSGLTGSWASHYEDVGLSAGLAATAVTVYGLFSVLSRFVWGFLVEHYHVRTLLIFQMLLMAGTMLLLLQVNNAPLAMIAAASQGIILGGYVGMNPLIFPNYFGRANIGTIRGTFAPARALSSAAGPLVLAYAWDLSGSYSSVYLAILFTWLLAAIFMYLARPVQPPVTNQKDKPAEAETLR